MSHADRIRKKLSAFLGLLLVAAGLVFLSSCTEFKLTRPDELGSPRPPEERMAVRSSQQPDVVSAVPTAMPHTAPGASWMPAPPPAIESIAPDGPNPGAESYAKIDENGFQSVASKPLSTFSADVDTASYSNVRRMLNEGKLPPSDAVRIEEFVNYFHYDYPQPRGDAPIAVASEVCVCPWNSEHRLVRIGLQAKQIEKENLPARNLVFLVDTSGSMSAPNRLPLLKTALGLLVEQLTERDRVAIVSYAGRAGLELPSTPGSEKAKIVRAIEKLDASGSTNGGEGIRLAYQVAQQNFIKNGINRVILGTDGDFNVGVTSQDELLKLIEKKRKSGVFLTVLGFGMGNLKDSTMEKLADHGNGHYAYIDSMVEARKVFVEQGAALVTVAKDVKLQIEFNPRHVESYRLVGYEKRILRDKDFNNDKKDAGDMGAGHTVTALYEIVPVGAKKQAGVDPLRYQQDLPLTQAANSGELLTLKIRYKDPDAETSKLLTFAVLDSARHWEDASPDFRFAAALAQFGMLLRDSSHKGKTTFSDTIRLAKGAKSPDPQGYREECIKLMETAKALKNPNEEKNTIISWGMGFYR